MELDILKKYYNNRETFNLGGNDENYSPMKTLNGGSPTARTL